MVTSIIAIVDSGGGVVLAVLVLIFNLPVPIILMKCQEREQSGQVQGREGNNGLRTGLAAAPVAQAEAVQPVQAGEPETLPIVSQV